MFPQVQGNPVSCFSATEASGGSRRGPRFWSILLITAGILYLVTRSYHLNYFALWNDEVFSVTVAKMPWPGMFRAVADDIVHPPLFYILLKSWIYVGGSSVLWMRLLPFLISVATLVPLLLLFREWKLSPLEMTLAMVLISFNELLIYYSQELGLLLFLIPVLVALVYRPERRDLTVLLTLFGFFPPAVSIAASYLMQQSVFGARYLITAVVPCLLLVAMGIAGMSALPKKVIGSLLLAWAVLSGVWFTMLPDRKVPWDTLAHYLAASKSLVYTYERHEQTPLQYYGVSTNLIDKREVEQIEDRDFYLVYRPDTVGSELQNLESHGYGVMDKYMVHGNEEIIAVHLRRQ